MVQVAGCFLMKVEESIGVCFEILDAVLCLNSGVAETLCVGDPVLWKLLLLAAFYGESNHVA